MRFAWLQTKREAAGGPGTTEASRLLVVTYNALWWVPVALPFLGLASYRTSSLIFLGVTMTRALVNLYRNNVLPIDRAIAFPFRLP